MKNTESLSPLHVAVLATDVVLFTIKDDALFVRLITVDRLPHFKNIPGLPGGLIDAKETAEEAALRHLQTKAGISSDKLHLEQLYTFSAIKRDPRGRVVAVAYLALIPWEQLSSEEQEDTETAYWHKVQGLKGMAYDHDEILSVALERLRSRIHYTTLISKLLPKEVTLTDLETAYELLLGTDLDKRNFRKKILKLNILKELPKKRTGGSFRPAQLYTFASDKVKEIEML